MGGYRYPQLDGDHGAYDPYLAGWSVVLVQVASGMVFNTFLFMGYFSTVAKEIEEAARVDGASFNQTFRHVMLPLARPMLATPTPAAPLERTRNARCRSEVTTVSPRGSRELSTSWWIRVSASEPRSAYNTFTPLNADPSGA